jgi:hypothetical protein
LPQTTRRQCLRRWQCQRPPPSRRC